MVLTKKDFIRRAKLIRSFRKPSVKRKLMNASIIEFKKSNIKFDEKRFREFVNKK